MTTFNKITKRIFSTFGLEVHREKKHRPPIELTKQESDIVKYVKDKHLSMSSYENLWTTLLTCKHAVEKGIEGDFVETGVWRGGNALVAAAYFKLYGVSKKVYLFDTYEGMTIPTDHDIKASNGEFAIGKFHELQKETHNEWCYASIEDVKNNFHSCGLLENAVFIKGDVCKTLDSVALPKDICVLRLDTDWYESTKKGMEVLYPKISLGGAFIFDDYGHWSGAKEAIDEYFKVNRNRPFLHYVDFSCRMGIKKGLN